MSRVVTFYQFAPVADPAGWCTELEAEARALRLKGTVLLAEEGINGTLAGAEADLRDFAAQLRSRAGFADMPFKYSGSEADNPVFYRLKVTCLPGFFDCIESVIRCNAKCQQELLT